ncbi:MAG TPA: bacteriohemerythrin [Desulfuromonadales bacterium]|nr:bacteriohemerythrin [Desulfuromonadales bacterium]
MEFFKWKHQFSVNIPEMDQQHQKFMALLNKVHLYSETQDRDPEFLTALFRELFAYVLTHFEEEETLLEQTGFPGLEVQKKQHQYFRDQLVNLREQHLKGNATAPLSVLIFMRDWFMNHVLEFDKKYGEYFKNL